MPKTRSPRHQSPHTELSVVLRPFAVTVMALANRKHSVWRRISCALIALAFASLVSLAATHLHVGPDADEECAICAAVIGKLEGPVVPLIAAIGPELGPWPRIVPKERPLGLVVAVVLPPSCGPPHSS
jgi:hypothetical protein